LNLSLKALIYKMKIPLKKEFGLFLLLAVFGIATRFVPHQANFTAVAALALFGAYLLPKKIAILLPLTVIFISDIFLGFYEIKLMAAVYLSFALASLLGFYLKKHSKTQTVVFGSLLCALTFFIITNGAVFLFSPWYTKNIAGLWQCFLLALPFFKNNLLGNLFYSTLLFSTYYLWLCSKNFVLSFLKKISI